MLEPAPVTVGEHAAGAFLAVGLLLAGAGVAEAQDNRDAPILVVTQAGDPFGRYYGEILRAEGLAEHALLDIGAVTPARLARRELVVLAPMALESAEVATLRAYVEMGGNLVAMRPDAALAELLGLEPTAAVVSDGYFHVDVGAPPGTGAVDRDLQFHGSADLYDLRAGTRTLATLRRRGDTTVLGPAVTIRDVGARGGHAVAFVFDVARSVVYTRQGNPAWAGTERDGRAPMRPDDLFYPDWVDLENLPIPQADELQRLVVNVVLETARTPLPRFWYLPREHHAVLVLTADDHGSHDGIVRRFDAILGGRAAGCSLDDWSCTSATSYVSATSPLTDEQAARYRASGLDIGWHVDTECRNWTREALDAAYTRQLAAFAARFPHAPPPTTSRTHCIVWSDWASQAHVELQHGIRLDTNYYHWPAAWLHDRAGMFTGSGLPMRFADLDGSPIDVYQASTVLTDESGQPYPAALDALLDHAGDPEGYVGAFVANLHTDAADDDLATAAIDSARRHGAPVISADQLLRWLDARDASTLSVTRASRRRLTFAVHTAAVGLTGMLPTRGTLASIAAGGGVVPFTRRTVHGIEMAVFPVRSGTYVATYASRSMVDEHALQVLGGADVRVRRPAVTTAPRERTELVDHPVL